jgi:TolB-like protein/Tfp pilus assembly protein PilF
MPLAAGARFGAHEIVAFLGAGGMGEVWRARDTRLEREVALKVLPPASLDDETARARLLREARLASRLNHPHVCTIHEVGEAEGRAFVAMELVEGRPLSELLSRGPLPTEQVLRLGQQLADALAHAHEHGVVHRDFKSANVVLTPEGRAKVLDFGLAKRLAGEHTAEATTASYGSLTAPGTLAGTLAYMAPEQLRGQPADARSDIWALGVVLYEMVSGRRPFHGQTGFALSSAILNESPPVLPPGVPDGLRGVVERCLAKEPAQRYQRAAEVRAALEALASGVALPPGRAKARRPPRQLWLAAGLVVLAAVVTVAITLDFGALRRGGLGGMPHPVIDSLAVLPLENLSGDPEQGYLADGMHDALITSLGQISSLKRVIARGSVLRFKGTSTPLQAVARELGVAALITGSVVRSGGRVRVTAQLIDPKREAQVWAHSYESSMSDVLALENEIVAAITREVKLQLTPQDKARLASSRPVNPESHEAYLKGMYYLYKKTPEGFAKGLALLQQAIEKDPSDPLPYAGVGLAYPVIYHGLGGPIPPKQGFPRARAAALKALELDESLPQGHAALAAVKIYFDHDWPGAEREFRRALELNPQLAEAHVHFAAYHFLFGHDDEALAEAKRGQELDPLSALNTAWVGWLSWELGHPDEGIKWARKALEIDPSYPDALYVLGGSYADKGMAAEAIAAEKKLAAAHPDWRFGLAETYAQLGRKSEALQIVAQLERENYPKNALPMSWVYYRLGDREETIRALEAAYEYRHIFLPWILNRDWILNRKETSSWRSDPRWQALRRSVNLPLS